MNAKVIFALSALFACACASDTKDLSITLWDEAAGKLKFSAALTITKIDDHFHVDVKNVKIISKEGATAETVLPSFAWVLTDPIENPAFDFTLNPAEGTSSVTSPPGSSESARGFANWFVQSIAQGKGIEHYYKKGEKPPTREASSFFGTCGVKNIKKVNKGDDLILTFDIDHVNCSKRNPYIESPATNDNETHRFVFQGGNKLSEISISLDFEKDSVTHHTGGKLVYA